MKRIAISIVSLVMCILLSACGECKHAYSAPNCVSPATCSKCGTVSGEALGHIWNEATCTGPAQCERCGQTRGEALGHDWIAASCTEAKKCERCGKSEGNALGHEWMDATCVSPKTCSICGKKEGKELGHVVESWEIVTAPSCTTEGVESGICTVCGETIEQLVEKLAHTPSEWKIETPAKKDTPGIRIKSCTVCEERLEKEEFTLTSEEAERVYKSQCKNISYRELQRNPKTYKGNQIKVSGTIYQVISEAKSSQYYSKYFLRANGNLYLLKIDNYSSDSRILEDDYLTIWGEVQDLYEYETVRGNSNIVPSILVEYYK